MGGFIVWCSDMTIMGQTQDALTGCLIRLWGASRENLHALCLLTAFIRERLSRHSLAIQQRESACLGSMGISCCVVRFT